MRRSTVSLLFSGLVFFVTVSLSAQQIDLRDKEASRQGLWYLSPEADLWFGAFTIVEISPQIAYHLTDRWSLGTGINYNFYKEIESYFGPGYSTHLYGARAFSRLTLLRNAEQWLPFYLFSDMFVHLEFQMMNLERKYFSPSGNHNDGRFWTEQVYIGAGITQNISPMSSYSILVLWDLNRNINSPYGNPVYRIGLNIYLGKRSY